VVLEVRSSFEFATHYALLASQRHGATQAQRPDALSRVDTSTSTAEAAGIASARVPSAGTMVPQWGGNAQISSAARRFCSSSVGRREGTPSAGADQPPPPCTLSRGPI
jgi:hypothetical protein